MDAFERARTCTFNSAEAQNSIGLELIQLGAYAEAEQCLERALTLAPGYAFTHSNLGKLRQAQMRFRDAEAAVRKAIDLKPNLATLHANLGAILNAQGNNEAAETACRKAIELDGKLAAAWHNLGTALLALKHYEDAVNCFSTSLQLCPDTEFLFGSLIHTRMKICDWRSLKNDLRQLLQKIDHGDKATEPFVVLGLTTDLAVQRRAAEIWVKSKYPEQPDLGPIPKRSRHNKIRIGYYSADYHNHPTTYLIAELFERHNNDKFELIGFSFGPDKNDEMRKRVAAAFDQFIDVRGQSGKAVAQLSRELEIDIAVDLKGYTEDCRIEIFSHRAAPVQVNYLGYPGTMGAKYIDYLIADRILIPTENQLHYAEKIVYLPYSYQVNDAKRKIANRLFTREELDLPPTAFVFCCFNNNYKITPLTFNSWMRILKRVENSVLWLLEDNPTAADNLRKEADSRGIDSARLVFAKRMSLDEHLARHRAADLFIDTLPYNAHTSASDSLWAGLPVLTCIGEAFASRVAASLLNAICLPELITSTQEEYEALAVELASHPERLTRIKWKLEQNKLTAPLFDTPLFTKHIEMAYATMYQRYLDGIPPEHISIDR
jgi:predicted O-linked N-acetylglucosamine transferase (SPINDLY family)